MKKILFFIFNGILAVAAWGQNQDTLTADSILIGSHSEFSVSEVAGETKVQGDSAYMRNDYASAIQIYEALLKQGEAAEVYYNLGNSYFKTDDIARAILNYERALLLQPGNSDIRANLEIARAKTIDKVTPIPEIFFVSWIKSLIHTLSIDAWARLGISCFILFLVSLFLFFFSKQILWKKIGFGSGIFFLLFMVFCNVFASQLKNELIHRNKAIVLLPSITVRSTPSESGTSLFILHEGRKVEIKDDSMREWKEIRLEDGKVGWVTAASIELI